MNNSFALLQFADSTFPVGAFSFSNGLETAAHLGIVHDAITLKSYVTSIARQAAYTDGIASLHTWRNAVNNELASVIEVDKKLLRFKMNDEARLMAQRMGKKFAELAVCLFNSDCLMAKWLNAVTTGKTAGCYPIALALAFYEENLDEYELFSAHQYGVINMVLAAALRCVRVSHYDTQKILFEMGKKTPIIYEEIKNLTMEDMRSFVPQMDIFASLHEKGQMRMFMN